MGHGMRKGCAGLRPHGAVNGTSWAPRIDGFVQWKAMPRSTLLALRVPQARPGVSWVGFLWKVSCGRAPTVHGWGSQGAR
eukprot:6740950-Pyramimonas_sp.AAC.1